MKESFPQPKAPEVPVVEAGKKDEASEGRHLSPEEREEIYERFGAMFPFPTKELETKLTTPVMREAWQRARRELKIKIAAYALAIPATFGAMYNFSTSDSDLAVDARVQAIESTYDALKQQVDTMPNGTTMEEVVAKRQKELKVIELSLQVARLRQAQNMAERLEILNETGEEK